MNRILPAGFLDQVKPTYVEVGFSDHFADGLVHNKTVPFAIIATPMHGQYEITCQHQTEMISPGEAFLTRPNRPMRIVHRHGPSGVMSAQWIHLSATVLDLLDLTDLLVLPLRLPRERTQVPAGIIQSMRGLSVFESPLTSIAWNQHLWRLIHFLLETFQLDPNAEELLRGPARLRPLLLHLRERLAYPITPAAMAKFAGLSPSHLHHSFKRLTGIGPAAYFKAIRLDEAARQLLMSDLTVAEISASVGFSNAFHFSREFKRRFQVSPSVYRRLQKHPAQA